nr:GNAT family N-acetyltransferase [uncultured Bdellovibrio sp.]
MNLILRELTKQDEAAFLRGVEDWKGEDLTWYTFEWKPGMSHEEHLQILENAKDANKIPPNRVPSSMLYAFVGGEIVGRLNIRHSLNAYLLERGGHVGYAVSPRHRQKGYASEIFRQGLQYCQKLGIEKLLITCADHNVPSWRIIEKFGGFLENRIFDDKKSEFVRRYWIDLADAKGHPFSAV